MSRTRTRKTAQASSSTDNANRTITINLTAPTSWHELSQEQLRYVLQLMTEFGDGIPTKVMMFVRFCGIEVIKRTRMGWKCRLMVDGKPKIIFLQRWQIQSFIHQFDFIDTYEDMDCRLDAVCGLEAVDPLLHGVSFGDYLMAEKYVQIYIQTKEDAMLDNLAVWLYVDGNGLHAGQEKDMWVEKMRGKEKVSKLEHVSNDTDMALSQEERLGTFLWYSHVKSVLSKHFTHFFRKVDADDADAVSGRSILEQYNIQLRALTGGDATKEKDVLALDCWRALTELDAKAREAEELEKIRKKS